MERGFYNDEFEELIKQKADQHRMYPSEQAWKGINRSLHTRKKWYWFGFVLFIAGIGYYAIDQFISPSDSKQLAAINKAGADKTTNDIDLDGEKARRQTAAIPFLGQVTQKGLRNDPAGKPRSFVSNPDNTVAGPTRIIIPPIRMTGSDPASNDEGTAAEAGVTPTGKPQLGNPSLADRLAIRTGHNKGINAPLELNRLMLFKELQSQPTETEAPPATEPLEAPKLTDAGLEEDQQRINWMQQFAVYNLQVPKLKRLSWQLAFAPTMSYRKLTSNDAYISGEVKNVPMAPSVAGDPNKLVNHKPALGFELGSHFQYALNRNLQIRAGAQFNYSRYAIQAYGSYSSDVATIALNTSSNGHTFDSVTNLTRIRNFGGDVSENLQNQYFQVSLPVGFEYKLIGAGKLQVGMAGTIQPTFLINRQSYLITTDYKNYTQEPSLVRRWNVNTGAEIYLAYKSGDLKWQIGPQFRYQLFSSYVEKYPIREYLMEYGLKIGVTKTIR